MASSTHTASFSLSTTFAALRHRNYRLWYFGQIISLVGTWMQNTAQGYLVYTLTGSAAYLGYVGFISGIPSWLFMIYSGVIADRVSRRVMLIITQSVMMVLAFVLAILVFSGAVQPWHILILSFLLGVANAFEVPARQSFVVELVDREDVTNAIALNATMFNLGAIVGPATAGIIYALTGPGWCFTINGISFIAVISALLMMNIKPTNTPVQHHSAISAMVEGFKFVRANRMVLTLMVSVFIVNALGFGVLALLPAWAVKILGGDVTTNGWLVSARAVGAVIGGLLIATYGSRHFRGKMWAASSIALPIFMAGFAFARWLPLSMLILTGMGLALVNILNNSNAMVQSICPDLLRGRVMGLYSLMFMGGGPIGSLVVGIMADRTSEPLTALICAFVLMVFAIIIWVARPEVRAMG